MALTRATDASAATTGRRHETDPAARGLAAVRPETDLPGTAGPTTDGRTHTETT